MQFVAATGSAHRSVMRKKQEQLVLTNRASVRNLFGEADERDFEILCTSG
jgi:hypothetical protein